ncbi:MAG: IS1634 family transposase [Solirubrobacterales bacterium]
MGATASQPREQFELRSEALGALPIVRHHLERMRVEELLGRYLGSEDGRSGPGAARAAGVVVRNLCLGREPLYGLGEWAAGFERSLLGLGPGEAELLNDDRVGRALDRLFEADRGSLLCELVVGVIEEFEVDTSQLHNDSTSLALHGSYERADGRPRAGRPTPAITRGHSKDHRPDLKQLVWILTVARDGAVPLAHRVCDGNTADQTTHIESWDGLRRLVGRADFLYVADSKLATREQMGHIAANGGRFVCVLPASRSEDRLLREWMRTGEPQWTEAARRPARRGGEPPDVWSVAPPPIASAEGHRLVWVRSSRKTELDERARADAIGRGLRALERLAERLRGPKCRFREREAVAGAARSALRAKGVEQLVRFEIEGRVEVRHRVDSTGPGRKPHRRRLERPRFTLRWELDEGAIAHEAACDGCYPLVSNDPSLTDAELLLAYRYQPNLEKRHHLLKGVLDAAPVYLKSPARIEALFACHFLALLLHAVVERELRRAMARQGIDRLPLYPEARACRAPTAARVFELFVGVSRHRLLRHGELVQVFEPKLTALQEQLLDLLGVPLGAYASTASAPGP